MAAGDKGLNTRQQLSIILLYFYPIFHDHARPKDSVLCMTHVWPNRPRNKRQIAHTSGAILHYYSLHTDSSFTWCHELDFLLSINHGIAVISTPSAHLAERYAGLCVWRWTPSLEAQAVFEIYLEKGLNPNPRKCNLFAGNVQFCGRLIDSKIIKFLPRQYEALT